MKAASPYGIAMCESPKVRPQLDSRGLMVLVRRAGRTVVHFPLWGVERSDPWRGY